MDGHVKLPGAYRLGVNATNIANGDYTVLRAVPIWL